MKNKLLLTSALAGSLLVSASAFAETKITGSIEYSWAGTSKGGSATTDSIDGIGAETQINISNSGDLNVGGLTYKAGFSLEADGGIDAYEGAHIRVISGNTSIEMSQDSFQPLDGTVTPRVSLAADSLDPNNTNVIAYSDAAGGDLTEKMGVGIAHNIEGIGKVGAFYARRGLSAADNTKGNDNVTDNATRGGYEVNFKGNLGVEGLTVLVGKSDQKKNLVTEQDTKGTMYSAAYNFGQIAVGYARVENDKSTVGSENETDEFGITYSVNDNLSVGVQHIKTDIKTASSSSDEKIVMANIGYNLGGIGLSLNYADVQDAGGTANNDYEFYSLRLISKF